MSPMRARRGLPRPRRRTIGLARAVGGLIARGLAWSWHAAKPRRLIARGFRGSTGRPLPGGSRRATDPGRRSGGARRNGRAKLPDGQAWICPGGGELARRCDRRGDSPAVPRDPSVWSGLDSSADGFQPSRTRASARSRGGAARSRARANRTHRDRTGLLQTRGKRMDENRQLDSRGGEESPRSSPPAKAIGYASCALPGSAAALELKQQAEVITRECKRRGIELLEVVGEHSPKGGRATSRPGLEYALDRLDSRRGERVGGCRALSSHSLGDRARRDHSMVA